MLKRVLLSLLIIVLLYGAWEIVFRDRYRADTIYAMDGEPIVDGMLVVDRHGSILSVREANFLDSLNPLVKRFDGAMLPGLIDPFASTECVLRKVSSPPELSMDVWHRRVESFYTGYFTTPYQPWVTSLNEFFAMDSLYYRSSYIRYIIADAMAHGTTTTVFYPPVTLESSELPFLSLARNAKRTFEDSYAGAYSSGIHMEPIAEVELRYKTSSPDKIFMLQAWPGKGEIMSAYRLGIVSSKSVVLARGGSVSEEELAALNYVNAGVILSYTEDKRTTGIIVPINRYSSVRWGISSGALCSGSRSMLDELKNMKGELELDDEELWKHASAVNGELLGLKRGALKEGNQADFIVVSLSTDTLILDEVSSDRIDYVYRDGETVLDHSRFRALGRRTLADLRQELDSMVRAEGKHLGSAESYGLINPLND